MLAKRNIMPGYLLLLFSFCALFVNQQCNGEFLRVQGRDFYFGTRRVFLSGVNYAWVYYGHDFGNDNYQATGERKEQWIRDISNAGGNSLRVWLHPEVEDTPQFDANGYVIATDAANTMIRDLSRFLDVAEQYNVFVILTLFNGAVLRNDRYRNLIMDDARLQSYINYALVPLVQGLATKHALAAWDIINEPEGSIAILSNPEPCFDTSRLGPRGAGWTEANVPIQQFLRFINRQAAAIKRYDPKALVTVGSWSEYSQTNAFPDTFNYYQPRCLELAGGEPLGTVDFYQIHTYSWEGNWNQHSPFRVSADDYQLNGPLVIGEFSSVCAEGEGVQNLWNYSHDAGYDGAWSWQFNLDNGHCQDSQASQILGMQTIRYRDGVHVEIQ